jgi:type IV secretion system protein VirB9
MIVRTDTRTYAFDLETGDGVTAMLVRFVYPEDHRMGSAPPASQFASQGQFAPQAQFQGGQFRSSPPGGMAQAVERYRLKGDKALRPDWIADDGQRMFLRWSEDKPMPAVFAVDDTGREMTVDGFMRNGATPSTGSGRSRLPHRSPYGERHPPAGKGQKGQGPEGP